MPRLHRKFWWIVALGCALWLLWMTLRPNPQVAGNLEILTTPAAARGISAFWLIDIAGNIVVFVPLGASVALALDEGRRRWLWGTLAGLALSVVIETLQGLTSSRVSSLADVALNTTGAAVGAGFVVFILPYLKTIAYCVFHGGLLKKYGIRNTKCVIHRKK